jgi:hypothetical protein
MQNIYLLIILNSPQALYEALIMEKSFFVSSSLACAVWRGLGAWLSLSYVHTQITVNLCTEELYEVNRMGSFLLSVLLLTLLYRYGQVVERRVRSVPMHSYKYGGTYCTMKPQSDLKDLVRINIAYRKNITSNVLHTYVSE